VIVSYLELTDPTELRPPSADPRVEHSIERVHDPALNRRLYEEIGADWSWTDRLSWSEERWQLWASEIETWVVSVDGEPAGYVELRSDGEGSVLISIFGLLKPYHGLGLGGTLLTHAIRRGFELGDRVWVSTNTRDGPHALANYRARGMRIFRRQGSTP
jgi:GNAT superfamily N-acetyltransferase